MKKKLFCLILALVCALTLTACGCKHEIWNEADCVNPKTCSECGETEGEPLGHAWKDATCDNPKTCSECGETEGAPLGHMWQDATCQSAKKCSTCGKLEGNVLEHSWTAATCETPKTCSACGETDGDVLDHAWADATTEAPKTCTACGVTEGDRIITDSRFVTASTKMLYGIWACRVDADGELMDLTDFSGTLPLNLMFTFTNDGHLTLGLEVADRAEFLQAIKLYMIDSLYQELASSGLNQEQADAAMMEVYGMTVEQYAEAYTAQMDTDTLFADAREEYVYYVEGNTLYVADSWSDEFEPNTFTLSGDSLSLEGLGAEIGIDVKNLVFTKTSK